jgi:hypothetical protein
MQLPQPLLGVAGDPDLASSSLHEITYKYASAPLGRVKLGLRPEEWPLPRFWAQPLPSY